ncbi:hypothetical protein KUTeg_007737, partial [Tegillarca granosa]
MKFDDILSKLGEFGAYQKRLYLLLCIPAISVGSFMMMLIVVMETPEHRCKIPGYENDTYAVQGHYHQGLINVTIPKSTDLTKKYDQCHIYLYNDNYNDTEHNNENRTLTECTEWVYEQTTFTETFTSKTNLVCKDALKTSHAQMIFYFGVLLGDFLFGVIADWVGRKKSLYIALIILIASSFAVAWIPNYVGFVILQFIIGGTSHGAFVVCCVLGLELVGPTKRVWVGLVIQGFFATGLVYLAGIGYFVQQWQYIDIAVAIPCIFYLPAISGNRLLLIPESPRWLISQGRRYEANNIIRKAAKVNKVVLPENLIDSRTTERSPQGQIWHLFTSKVFLMYYGVTMNSGNIGGNFFLNFFLFACMEYPAYAIAIFFLDKVGRKKLHCACMILALYPLTLTLALIGKLGASAAFGIIYVFSAELFPTVVRNAGMGTSSCVARIGGMLAPYIAKSGSLVGGNFGKALPLVIFGAFSISAGLLCLLLPETLNQKLPDTLEEGRRFG